MYVDLGTGVRRSKDVPRITYVLKSALVPDLLNRVYAAVCYHYLGPGFGWDNAASQLCVPD